MATSRIEIASCPPATVLFLWHRKPDSGVWFVAEHKPALIARGQKCYPGEHQVRGLMYNHMEDVEALYQQVDHPGLRKAINNFKVFAAAQGWTGWLFPTDDLPPLWELKANTP